MYTHTHTAGGDTRAGKDTSGKDASHSKAALHVPLGAKLRLTFKVLERSSQTEVHAWGARVFLYVFQDTAEDGDGVEREGWQKEEGFSCKYRKIW